MRWRLFKLDWRYALGELAIVTVGVLIALAIDQWNDERLARSEETDAIAGILADLEEDLSLFEAALEIVEQKQASLDRVRTTLAAGVPDEPRAFLQDVINGSLYGWSQGLASRATYDDLLGSGKLGVIGDRGMRQAIATYYRAFESDGERIDERETPYPNLSYALVPRQTGTVREGNVGDILLRPDLSDAEVEALVAAVRDSQLASYVIAESNLAEFIRAIMANHQRRALALAERLQSYRETNRPE